MNNVTLTRRQQSGFVTSESSSFLSLANQVCTI